MRSTISILWIAALSYCGVAHGQSYYTNTDTINLTMSDEAVTIRIDSVMAENKLSFKRILFNNDSIRVFQLPAHPDIDPIDVGDEIKREISFND